LSESIDCGPHRLTKRRWDEPGNKNACIRADDRLIFDDERDRLFRFRGRLRIAMPLTFGPTHFTPMLAEMSRRHPQLHIHASYSDRFVDLIAEGFDCAIRVGTLRDSNLIARRVGPIYGTLVASPDYIAARGSPEAPEDLVSHQVDAGDRGAWRFMDGDEIITVQPRGHFKADNGTALAVAAVAGLGIARLPACIIHEYVASGALVPVMLRYPLPQAGAFVVRPPGQHPERKIRVLTELLVELFERDPRFRERV
jgi:DNA-binding transcriptional LysR family regulator